MSSSNQDRTAKEILEVEIEDELAESFLSYSLSVITSRAIPDVRDGLKPVQRRLLYGLHTQGLRPDVQYKKSARLVGEVLGKYHPHGDSACYEALVRMAQDFSMRVPLVDGQGNFGSPDDGPAAMRYTECRMDSAALDMLAELDEDTVNWAPNYDNTEQEPTVLPSSLPNLLVNGATGIAVGMATNLAPHNPSEVLAAMRLLLHNPDATLDDIMEVVPAPDFPTGGIIIDSGGIREAYETGRGAFKIRGTTEITQVSQRRRGIVVTELPYNVGPERFIAKVKSLVTDKTLDGISDIIDLSDRKHGLRVVVEVKASASPEAVLAELYKRTPLEESFSINAVALVDGQPRTLGIIEMGKAWLAHRLEVLLRRTAHRLAKAEARAHIVEGLVRALARIEEVVALIRASESTAEARAALMEKLDLSEIQANHILEMPLRRLTSLEAQKLTDELAELRETIEYLNRLLTDTGEQTAVIDGEIAAMEARHGSTRRARILGAAEAAIDIPEGGAATSEPCAVWLSATGTVGRANPDDPAPKRPSAADIVTSVADCSGETDVWAVCDTGRLLGAHPNLVAPIEGRSRGGRVEDLFELERGENVVALVGDRNLAAGTLVVVTANGIIKRVDGTQLPGRLPSQVIGLKDGDRVIAAFVAGDDTDAVLVASSGQVLRTPTGSVRPQGRGAGGVTGIRLAEDHQVIAAGPAIEGAVVCVATDSGAVKTTPVDQYPSKGRGGQGVRGVRMRSGESTIVAAAVTPGPVGVSGTTKITLEGSEGKRDGAAVALDVAPEKFGWVRASV